MSFFGKKEEDVFELTKALHPVSKPHPTIGARPYEPEIPQEDPEVLRKRDMNPGLAVFLDDLRSTRDKLDVLIKKLSQ